MTEVKALCKDDLITLAVDKGLCPSVASAKKNKGNTKLKLVARLEVYFKAKGFSLILK